VNPLAVPRAPGCGNTSARKFRTDVFQAGSSQNGEEALRQHRFAQPLVQIFHRQRALLEKLLHELVVALGDHLDQLFVPFFRGIGQFGGDLLHLGAAIAVGLVEVGLHRHQIDHAVEILFLADRQLHRHRAAAEHLLNRRERALEIGQIAIHPVHHEGARQAVLGAVVPYLFGDHLDAGHGVDQDQRGIGNGEGSFRFSNERAVARRIEQIDLDGFTASGGGPFHVGEAGLNTDFSGDLFLVPVRRGRAIGGLAQTIGHSGGIEQRGSKLSLSRAAMTDNADVSN
jgi:hypothetical protein